MARLTGPRPDMTPDPREERLPVWAQDKLHALRRELAAAEEARDMARLQTRPADAEFILDPYSRAGEPPVGLPRRSWLRRPLGPLDGGSEPHIDPKACDVSLTRERGALKVPGLILHGDSMIISLATSSNVLEITTAGAVEAAQRAERQAALDRSSSPD